MKHYIYIQKKDSRPIAIPQDKMAAVCLSLNPLDFEYSGVCVEAEENESAVMLYSDFSLWGEKVMSADEPEVAAKAREGLIQLYDSALESNGINILMEEASIAYENFILKCKSAAILLAYEKGITTQEAFDEVFKKWFI